MHGKEREVEPDKEQPEVKFAERFAQHAASPFGEPVIDSSKQREHRPANQHVMEMGHDKKSVVDLCVERHGSQHNSGQSADDKNSDKTRHPEQGSFELRFAAVKSRKPAENLDAIGNGDHHARASEEALPQIRNRRGEHVMDPETKPDEPSREQGKNHGQMTENAAARKRHDD